MKYIFDMCCKHSIEGKLSCQHNKSKKDKQSHRNRFHLINVIFFVKFGQVMVSLSPYITAISLF